jgi:hypothetical protein
MLVFQSRYNPNLEFHEQIGQEQQQKQQPEPQVHNVTAFRVNVLVIVTGVLCVCAVVLTSLAHLLVLPGSEYS